MTVDEIKKIFPSLTEEEILDALQTAQDAGAVIDIPSNDGSQWQTITSYGETSSERINHPSHYTWLKEKCGIEVIDITRHLDFCIGNAVKYLLRAGHKSEQGYTDKAKTIEDLKKAVWYINDKINSLENGGD